MMSNTILYIGNDLAKNSKYNSAMETLSSLLITEGYAIVKSSSKKNQLLRLINMCFSVYKYSGKVDYVLIDTFSTSAFYYAFFTSQLARLFNLKYIPILHGGNLPHRIKRSPSLSKLLFNNSYKNIAPSNYLKSEFEKMDYKVAFIPNPIEIEQYDFKSRKKLTPKLLYVRAFAKIYNPKLAIEVLKILKLTFPEVKLSMVGPDKDGSIKQVKALVTSYNLEENIEFTGVLPKEEWHKKSTEFDVFINTTNVDNTPVSVMEAMALGLPVISTNVCGLPYLINNTVDGILVEKNNPEQMANAIISLIKDNNLELAINARKKAESFAWTEVRKEWIKILS
ncbi:glycosyl transferase family 1 [Tenacibaculum todarodis]|uniref:Glycosyl transferase family 1 n=1 Tax=Tenacibaculum todarodis TaxID=1850252 RepID=A0A1L3JHU0_9FLAO|nr:glycosyltransferase family 4 protein [Tenacibaculum todarodis]APG64688.1 glycosyl transferase family 1 [Tenacibaculum todarodis]